MKFFFVHDYKHRFRFFSSEPVSQIQVNFSRLRKVWEEAKKRIMLFPPRVLRQEQAFRRTPGLQENKVTIVHPDTLSRKKARLRFRFFLRRKKTSHILYLIGETFALPFTGLAGLMPGPNVFFGLNVLLIITHWRGLRGINRLLKKEYDFTPSFLLSEWEGALKSKKEEDFPAIIERIEKEYSIENIRKILWK